MPDLSWRVRPAVLADAEQIARVRVDTWHTTYRGIVPEPFLTSMSYAQDTERWKQILSASELNPSRIGLVAEIDGEEVVSFASGGPEREGIEDVDGELYALYLRKEQQGRGIGADLMREFLAAMKAKEFRSVLVWVLADNPTRAFYEHIGGIEIRRKRINLGGTELEEIAYKLKL